MAFEYEKPASAEGEWTNLTDLAKGAAVMVLEDGFLVDDPTNTYNGKPMPRFVVAGKVDGDPFKVGVTKGYGRDDLLIKAQAYLAENPSETISITFNKVGQYTDIDVA